MGCCFYSFRGDGKTLGITPWAVTSGTTVCGNVWFSPRSARKGTELQEKEQLVSKLGNIFVLENSLHLCYRALVKSLIAGIVTNCMFIILCSAWEARTWFVKCWALNSFYWSQCELCFDPLKHYKTRSNLKSEAMGIPPSKAEPCVLMVRVITAALCPSAVRINTFGFIKHRVLQWWTAWESKCRNYLLTLFENTFLWHLWDFKLIIHSGGCATKL